MKVISIGLGLCLGLALIAAPVTSHQTAQAVQDGANTIRWQAFTGDAQDDDRNFIVHRETSRVGSPLVTSPPTWQTKAPMPTARLHFGMAVSKGKVYVIGGTDGTNAGANQFLNTVEAYDPGTNTWATRANLPTARWGLGAATVNGVIYAIGGINGSYAYLGTVEAYDPNMNVWTSKANMPTPREELSVVAGKDGKIYAIGGWRNSNLTTVEIYDPATNTWSTGANMPTGRRGFGLTQVGNGKIYAVGGLINTGPELNNVEAYDPIANSWAMLPPLPTSRGSLAAVAGPDGAVYAIGGWIVYGKSYAVVERLDPATHIWTSSTSMSTPRYSLGGVLADNGKIYAIGGITGIAPTSYTLYNTVEEMTIVSTPPTVAPVPAIQLNVYLTTGNDCATTTSDTLTITPGTPVNFCYAAKNIGNTTLYTHTLVANGSTLFAGSLITLPVGSTTIFSRGPIIMNGSSGSNVIHAATWSAAEIFGATTSGSESATISFAAAPTTPQPQPTITPVPPTTPAPTISPTAEPTSETPIPALASNTIYAPILIKDYPQPRECDAPGPDCGEPNNQAGQAYGPLQLGRTYYASVGGANDPRDWYHLNLLAGNTYKVMLNFNGFDNPANADLDIAVKHNVPPNYAQVTYTSNQGLRFERFSFTASVTGSYLFLIDSAVPNVHTVYTLLVQDDTLAD